MHILITNDDSHASPLLEFLIDFLRQHASLTVVVPKFEQSWKGKCITRFNDLQVEEIEINGHPVYTVDGSPADCSNIGIYHLCPHAPDLIVSGINAGQNTGAAFLFSSGTVGACMEANIAGVPAIALSQHVDWALMEEYRKGYILSADVAARLREQTEIILSQVFSVFFERPQLLDQAITYNINFPWQLKKPVQIIPASVGKNLYGSLFVRKENSNTFTHQLRVISVDTRDSVDAKIVELGQVSLSILDILTFGQMDNSDQSRVLSNLFNPS